MDATHEHAGTKTAQTKERELKDASVVLQTALAQADKDASEEERILQSLLATEVPIIQTLNRAKAELALCLVERIDDAKRSYTTAKILKEVVLVSNALLKRSETVAGVLISMRSQRQMLQRAGARRR